MSTSSFRLSYRWRWLKNTGMSIILLWSFVAFTAVNYFVKFFLYSNKKYTLTIIFSICFLFPIVGWLADVYMGRYRVIKISMRAMFLGTILFSLKLALKNVVSLQLFVEVTNVISILLMCVGLSGFQANIVQFSMDQLFDSSSLEVTSFIILYVWSFVASNVVVGAFLTCVCKDYEAIASLLFPVLFTVALCTDILFNHWLVKEPVTHNPLKLIFKVLRYAIQNKYPKQRSAFTYWDDKRYSRIDLAKRKYGGPFSTEEVEDVKTFLKVLSIVVVSSFFIGLLVNVAKFNYLSNSYNVRGVLLLRNCTSDMKYPNECFKVIVTDIGACVLFIGIPLWEFCIFPIIWKCSMKLRILTRLALGMVVMMLYLTSSMFIELFEQLSINPKLSCKFKGNGKHHYTISYIWLAVPNCIYVIGYCLIAVASLEFLTAQSPYSMKGLMLGIGYFCSGVGLNIFYPISLWFGTDSWNCTFWYLLLCLLLSLVITIVFLIASCRYTDRKREDNLPSQQFIADVYSDYYHRDGNDSMSESLD